MLEIAGNIFYIDLTALENVVLYDDNGKNKQNITKERKTFKDDEGKVITSEEVEYESERGKEINAVKYETIRTMIEVLLDFNSQEEIDFTLGLERALSNTPLSYKIAFNTLWKYGILKEQQ